MQTRLVFAALLVAACGGGTVDDTIKVNMITPAFGPLSGGTHVVIKGTGFLRDGAPPNHVVVGTTDAPLASAIDDATLDVEIPPGTKAGDAPVIVFNRNGETTAMGMFHYSAAPTITGVAPADVLYSSGGTITLTGTGFQDENAGPPTVMINGQRQVDVMVTSDTSLTFSVQPGSPLSRPDISLTNARGEVTKTTAFRYVPSMNPSFLVFTNNDSINFMYIYDPTANMTFAVRNIHGTPTGYRTVFQDSTGAYFAIGNRFSGDNLFGKIDFDTQTLVDPITLSGRINSTARMGSTIYAVDRNTASFGTLDPKTGTFSAIGGGTLGCCTPGLASNGSAIYYVNGAGLSTVNPANGARGAAVALNPNKHVDELRFLNNTLYGITMTGEIFSVDTTTGVTTTVTNLGLGTRAISSFDVFVPGAVP